jgi:hypothetical protein
MIHGSRIKATLLVRITRGSIQPINDRPKRAEERTRPKEKRGMALFERSHLGSRFVPLRSFPMRSKMVPRGQIHPQNALPAIKLRKTTARAGTKDDSPPQEMRKTWIPAKGSPLRKRSGGIKLASWVVEMAKSHRKRIREAP